MGKAKNLYDRLMAIALKSLWQMLQLRQNVSPDIVEKIRHECCQNEKNPNFSFEVAINELSGNPLLPLDVWDNVIYDPNEQ